MALCTDFRRFLVQVWALRAREYPLHFVQVWGLTFIQNGCNICYMLATFPRAGKMADCQCQRCRKTFQARAGAKFCSSACRQAAHRGLDVTRAVCVVCGASLEGRRAGVKYCNKACNQKAYRRRYNEWKKRAMMRSRPVNNLSLIHI